jgi:threonylcarbamoyladenosine tRNA methylthiotransferase MtaB
MRRRYSALEYRQAVEIIRDRFPSAAITADVIVGFPGETENQFTETYNLCKEIKFANLHLFPYSSRPGTSAYYLSNKVDPKEIRKRMNLMLSLAKKQASDYRNSILGTKRKVLWETYKKVGNTTSWSGLTDNYIRVATASNKPLRNIITSVTLEKFTNDTVWARIL